MRYASVLLLSAVVVLAFFCPVSAHRFGPDGQGNPWFMPAMPDQAIPRIDGNLDDWAWWPSLWTFTRANFAATVGGTWSADETNTPADDWDAIIYGPAWIPATNQVTWALKVTDDIKNTPYDVMSAYRMDGGQFATDADHGGEPGPCGGGNGQEYQQNFWTLAEGGKVGLFEDRALWWEFEPPYTFYAFGDVQDNGSYQFEIQIALWDHLDPGGPGQSTRHQLTAGETIGFSIEVYDFDSADQTDEFPDFEFDYGSTCDGGPVMPDWQLLPIEETFRVVAEEGGQVPSAVEMSTWGRIKATFTK